MLVIGVRSSTNWLVAPAMASTMRVIAASISGSVAVVIGMTAPPLPSITQRGRSYTSSAVHAVVRRGTRPKVSTMFRRKYPAMFAMVVAL